MSNIISNLYALQNDLYLNILRHYVSLFNINDTFDKLLKEVKMAGTIPYHENGVLNIEPDMSDVIVLTPENYDDIRNSVIAIFNSGAANPFDALGQVYRFLDNVVKGQKKEYTDSRNVIAEHDTAVFYPWFGLGHVKATLTTIMHLRRDAAFSSKVDKVVDKIFARSRALPFRWSGGGLIFDYIVRDLISAADSMVSRLYGSSLLPDQLDVIEGVIKETPINVHGVAGGSKTFTLTLALIGAALLDFAELKKPVTFLLTATTYHACKAMLKNLYSHLSDPDIRAVLQNWRVSKVSVWYVHSASKRGEACSFVSGLTGGRQDQFLSIGNGTTSEVNGRLTSEKGDLNFVVAPSVVFKAYLPYRREGFPKVLEDIDVSGIHIDESSQFSFTDFIIMLYGILKFVERVEQDKRWRLSLSGDPLQLSPIYQYADGNLNLLRIGPFYNMLSYIYGLNIKEKHLKESLRIPKPVCDLVSNFYPAIYSCKQSGSPLKIVNQTTAVAPILQKTNSILRIEYTLPSLPGGFLPTKLNKIEACIIEEILDTFNWNVESFILSPFRAQETLLSNLVSHHGSNSITVGTVDKTQGQEADLVIYGFTVADNDFAEKVSEFIFNPNRFNVAVTRTKEFLVVISSSSVTQAAMSTISTSYKFMAEDMRTAYYKLHPAYGSGMSFSTEDALKILTGINSSKGAYMFQELVQMTNNEIGELYLPVRAVNGNLFSAGKLTDRPPLSPHATIRFYTI